MQNNKIVVGSYGSRDEALDVVQRLKNDGYQKQDIILYGNDSVANSIGDHEGVNVNLDSDKGSDSSNENESLWDQIKGAFTTDSYDDEKHAQSSDYNQEDDVLYPYRDDIKKGNIVVAVDNYRGEDIDQYNPVSEADSDIPTDNTKPLLDPFNSPDGEPSDEFDIDDRRDVNKNAGFGDDSPKRTDTPPIDDNEDVGI